RLRLRNDLVGVHRADGQVLVAVEYDRTDACTSLQLAGTCSHRCERGWHIRRGAAGETGMDTDSCEQVRIRRPHDRGSRPSRGKPSNTHTGVLNLEMAHDFAGDARNQRRLATVARLISLLEPIPASGRI